MEGKKMGKVIDQVKKFFDDREWNYKYIDDQKVIRTMVDMRDELGTLKIVIFFKDEGYMVYGILNSKASESKRARVAEYLHRANYGLNIGNFEFDYDDGEVRYKVYTECNNNKLINEDIIQSSIFIPIMMMDLYGKNLLKVMLNDDVSIEKAIEEVEEVEEVEE